MKRMRRLLSFLMALVLLLGNVVTPVLAEEVDQTEPVVTEVPVETEAADQIPETTEAEEPAETTVPEESTEAGTLPAETEAPTEETEAPVEETEAAAEETEVPTEATEAVEEETVPAETAPESLADTTAYLETEMSGAAEVKWPGRSWSGVYIAPCAGTFSVEITDENSTASISVTVGTSTGTSVRVEKDDSVTVTVTAEPEMFGSVTVNWKGTFVPQGSVETDPIAVIFSGEETDAVRTAQVTVPAGKTYYFTAEGITGMCLAIGEADAVLIESESFTVTNETEEEAVVTLTLTYPSGHALNPAPFQLGEGAQQLDEGNAEGFWYAYTAEEAGTVTVTLAETENGTLVIYKNEAIQGTLMESIEEVAVEVEAEETLLIQAVAQADKSGDYPAASISWTAAFAYKLGSEKNPIYPAFTWDGLEATAMVTVPGMTTQYFAVLGAEGRTLTANDEEIPMSLLDSDKALNGFSITNVSPFDTEYKLRLFYPLGAYENPEILTELPVDGQETQLKTGSAGYHYSYTATEFAQYTFVITGISEGCTGDIVVTNGTVEKRLSEEGELTILAGAGDELMIQVIAEGEADEATVTWSVTVSDPQYTEKSPKVIYLDKGKTTVLTPVDKATGEALDARLFTWKSENIKVVTVDATGKLTAKGAVGTSAVVTAQNDAGILYYEVRITNPGVNLFFENETEVLNFTNKSILWVLSTTDNSMALDSIITPYTDDGDDSNDAHQEVQWTSSSDAYAEVKDGLVVFKDEAAGKTVTITAVSVENPTKKATVKVKILRYIEKLSFAEIPEVAEGKSLKLLPLLTVEPQLVTDNKVTWELAEESKAYAKISSSGVLTANVLTANKVTETVQVTVICRSAKDSSISASCVVTIRPATTGVNLYSDADKTKPVTGKTMEIPLKSEDEITRVELFAKNEPEQASQAWTWKSSDKNVTVTTDGVVEIKHVSAGKTVTITAVAKDGTNKAASVKLKVIQPVEKLTLSNTVFEVAAGKAVKLAPELTVAPANATNKKVTWEITEGEAFGKISGSGVFTAYKIKTIETVTITCTADDKKGAETTCTVRILPVTESVSLKLGESDVTGKTETVFLRDNSATRQLTAANMPEQASQVWTWKSSDKNVTVKDGLVTFGAASAGKTVTITATASDGSNKKAVVKFKVIQPVESLTCPEGQVIAAGKSLNLAKLVTVAPANATDKKLTWKVSENTIGAKISPSGTLSTNAKRTAQKETVWVTVETADEGGCKPLVIPVTIYPYAVSNIKLYYQNGDQLLDFTGKTIIWNWSGDIDNSLKIQTEITPFSDDKNDNNDSCQALVWTSSNEEYASVENGKVIIHETGIGKTVTITATAIDGSGKKASFKIKIAAG